MQSIGGRRRTSEHTVYIKGGWIQLFSFVALLLSPQQGASASMFEDGLLSPGRLYFELQII